MLEQSFFNALLVVWFGLGVVIFVLLFFVAAPYGRHFRGGWGPTIARQLGWVVMEAPAAIGFVVWFSLGNYSAWTVSIVFLGLWEAHYIYRAFIYPLRLRGMKKRMPVLIVVMAFLFNVVNSYINGRYLFTFSGGYFSEWFMDLRFIIGLVFFILGFVVNHRSDEILLKLRRSRESEYRIPRGGLFRWVSCPNYFGEIVEWIGWGIMTWSIPGLVFACWTVANLVPRARSHHGWYQKHFSDYPPERKALVPGVW